MRRHALVVLPLAFLAACQPATTELTDEQKAEIAAEVDSIQAEFMDAWKEGDFERAITYYYDSPDLTVAIDGTIEHGYAEIMAKARPGYTQVASMDITITSSETIVLAQDVACKVEGGIMTATFKNGFTTPEQSYVYTPVWVSREGEWKIHVMHESFPPTQPM
jgi:uncharacterized protein (TIGR02246 family)